MWPEAVRGGGGRAERCGCAPTDHHHPSAAGSYGSHPLQLNQAHAAAVQFAFCSSANSPFFWHFSTSSHAAVASAETETEATAAAKAAAQLLEVGRGDAAAASVCALLEAHPTRGELAGARRKYPPDRETTWAPHRCRCCESST